MRTIILLCLFFGGTRASQMGDLAASMRAGEWRTLSTANIATVLGSAEVGGGATGGIMPFAEDGAWDPASERFFFVGGDHNWNVIATKFVSYSAANNAWQTMTRPPWATFVGAMHAYDHNAIDAAGGIFYCRKSYADRVFEKYNIASGTWTALPANNVYGYNYACCGALEYFPELKGLVFIQSNADGDHTAGVYFFSDSAQQWRKLCNNLPVPDANNFAEYNPVHHVMAVGGGRVMYKITAAGQVVSLGQPPLSVGVNSALFTVDPVGGEYLAFGRDGSFYAYDVTRDAWTRQPGSDFFSPTTNADGGIISQVVATPVSAYGVVLFAKFCNSNSNVYLYKRTGTAAAQAHAGLPQGEFSGPSVVYDIRGRVKARLDAGASWSQTGVPAGVYLIRHLGGNRTIVRRVVME